MCVSVQYKTSADRLMEERYYLPVTNHYQDLVHILSPFAFSMKSNWSLSQNKRSKIYSLNASEPICTKNFTSNCQPVKRKLLSTCDVVRGKLHKKPLRCNFFFWSLFFWLFVLFQKRGFHSFNVLFSPFDFGGQRVKLKTDQCVPSFDLNTARVFRTANFRKLDTVLFRKQKKCTDVHAQNAKELKENINLFYSLTSSCFSNR